MAQYSDEEAAALYELLNPWGPSDEFYLGLVMHATSVLEVVDSSGRKLHVWHEVETVAGDVVTLTETTGDEGGTPLRVDRAGLRFLGVDAVGDFLAEAGFVIEAQYGGWSREPLEPASPEIVTLARNRVSVGEHLPPTAADPSAASRTG